MIEGLVSVIIPTYNCAGLIKQSVESALAQDYAHKEVIVIDDGSTDNTAEVLKQYSRDIKYFYKENAGPASARNYGIEKSRGEFIAFLDADDIWVQGKLRQQVDYLRKNPEIKIGFGIPVFEDRTEEDYIAYVKDRVRDGYVFNELITRNFINTSTVILRRELLDHTGMFDEDRNLISVEDFNLWLRAARDFRFGFIASKAVIKRLHPGSFTNDYENMYKADLYNFHKLEQSFPEWKLSENKYYQKGLADYYCRFGDSYFYERKYTQAREMLWCSLKYNIFNPKALPRFFLTFFPSKFLNYVRRIKNG